MDILLSDEGHGTHVELVDTQFWSIHDELYDISQDLKHCNVSRITCPLAYWDLDWNDWLSLPVGWLKAFIACQYREYPNCIGTLGQKTYTIDNGLIYWDDTVVYPFLEQCLLEVHEAWLLEPK